MLKRLAVTIVLLMAFLYLVDPWLRDMDVQSHLYSTEAQAYSETIKDMPAGQLSQLVEQQGKPSLVLLYASWCGYCQHQIPILMDLSKRYGNQISFFYVSIDKSKTALSDYLLNGKHDFTAYHMPSAEFGAYQAFFGQYGGNFEGGIPYMAAFNAKGEMVLEMPGMVAKEGLSEALDALLK